MQIIFRRWLDWLNWTDVQDSWRPVNPSLIKCVHVSHCGWLCTTSRPAFLQGDVVHWLFMYTHIASTKLNTDTFSLFCLGWEGVCKVCLWARHELLQGTFQKVMFTIVVFLIWCVDMWYGCGMWYARHITTCQDIVNDIFSASESLHIHWRTPSGCATHRVCLLD